MGRLEEGLPIAQEAYELAKEHDITEIVKDLEMQWFPR